LNQIQVTKLLGFTEFIVNYTKFNKSNSYGANMSQANRRLKLANTLLRSPHTRKRIIRKPSAFLR